MNERFAVYSFSTESWWEVDSEEAALKEAEAYSENGEYHAVALKVIQEFPEK